jgi:hypothetical protein
MGKDRFQHFFPLKEGVSVRFISAGNIFGAMVGAALVLGAFSAQAWVPKKAALMTRWSWNGTASIIDAKNVWPQYPRPQMKRPTNTWMSLNGVWQFQKTANLTDPVPTGTLTGEILVPFPIESAISGVMDYTYQYAWYKKNFVIPAGWDTTKNRIILNFGAVDFQSQVFVNGNLMAQHTGGYDRFHVDITSRLANLGTGGTREQTVVVRIYDPSDRIAGFNPRGKQVVSPNGIFYSPNSGIWQTVWLEAVPKTYISDIKITPDVDKQSVKVVVKIAGDVTNAKLFGFAKDKSRATWGADSVAAASTVTLNIKLSGTNLWWPNRPYLYDLGLYLKKAHPTLPCYISFLDSVQSYFGMRKIEMVKVGNVMKPYLNGVQQFLFGPLDQGYWPDGIYTAPSYEAMKFDLVRTKDFGFNITRKHVKIEPELWYWACDSMGLMVYQDMPSEGGTPSAVGKTNFEVGYDSMITQLYNHPSIVIWTVFNEGWGQYDTDRLTRWVMTKDPSRLVNCATGWTWYAVGHFKDNHAYPAPSPPPVDANYICGTGEYGGLLVKVAGHEWNANLSFGYGGNNTPANAATAFAVWANKFASWKASQGTQITIYTGITDQEIECNGLICYDRYEKYTDAQQTTIRNSIVGCLDPYTHAAIIPASGAITTDFFNICTTTLSNGFVAHNTSSLKIARALSTDKAIVLSLIGKTASGMSMIRILNVRGQQMYSTQVASAKSIRVPTGVWAKGIYFVELNNGSEAQHVSCMVK